ncbi:MAG: PSD1 and planctomycete cytochrome C domain-containing protein [Aureliella sp.]
MYLRYRAHALSAACILLVLVSQLALASDNGVDFNRDVRPILSDRCFHCHGPDEADRQAELRLDLAEGDEGAYRDAYGVVAIAPGDLAKSEVWNRITSEDPDSAMPPPDSHKKSLTEDEKEIIRRWIEGGAKYDAFWAFVAPKKPELNDGERDDAIAAIVVKQLKSQGMELAPEADRRTLLRRLKFDLTGLPPTLAELSEFLEDESPKAYEKVVDRLLDSPHFGEHVGRYWLDLVRFADTNGIHHDHYRDHSAYRDWVIRAFNENLPYSDFVRYQIAGDLYEEPTEDQLIASGFHRLHLIIDVGTALPEESLHRNVLDRVTSVGTAFMGLTMQCAVCHDHKYDPITQKDFYSLSAFFNNVDATPETGPRRGTDFTRGLQKPYIDLPSEEQASQRKVLTQRITSIREVESWLRRQVQRLEKEREKLPAPASEPEGNETATDGSGPGESNSGDEAVQQEPSIPTLAQRLSTEIERYRAELAEVEGQRKAVEKNRDRLVESIPAAMVMRERGEIRPAFILNRGAYDDPGEQVPRATPGFLPPMELEGEIPTRMDLANWFVDSRNPLTARVTVNRFWQQLFGVGIVRTSEDFGAQGEWPAHPELLDYLAVGFVESNWDVKALFKQMVMSRVYRQESSANSETYRKDPQNRQLARGSRYRMDSEMIRDQVLAATGVLNTQLYGKSVKPPQPAGLWKAVSMPSSYPKEFKPSTGDDQFRRSVYTFWKRGMPPPQMTILNAPSREECIARRERTNTPLQALLLLNEPEFLKAASQLAKRVLEEQSSAQRRVQILFETITSHLPTESQSKTLMSLAADLEHSYAEDPVLARQLVQGRSETEHADVELAAWTMVASSIFNLDITKTRQ